MTEADESLKAENATLKERVAELEATLAKNQQIIEKIPQLVYVYDVIAQKNVMSNRELIDMLGYTPEQLLEMGDSVLAQVIHPEDLASVIPNHFARLAAARDGEAVETEYRLRDSDGSWRWVVARDVVFARTSEGGLWQTLGTLHDITSRKEMEENLHIFKSIVENATDGINVTNREATIQYANAAYRKMTGLGDAVVGRNAIELYHDDADMLRAGARQALEKGSWRGELSLKSHNGGSLPVAATMFSITNELSKSQALAAIVRDILELRKAEAERTLFQEQIIDAQRTALRELSSPLIPIADNVVLMPLIGSIDSARAQQVMETLLEGVAQHRADVAILDITGLRVVDTQVANALVHAAQAIRLLGARVVLTGISPSMAQTLVSLGIELSHIVTRGSLQSGIAYALKG